MGGVRRPRILFGRPTKALHEMGVAWGPRVALGLQDWGAYGPVGCRNGGHTAPEVVEIGGIRLHRLLDLVARGPLHDGHRVPMARGCLVPSSRGQGQLGSWQSAEEGCEAPA